jgi:hypothetical protein
MTIEFISRVPTDYSTTVHITYQKALPETIQYALYNNQKGARGLFQLDKLKDIAVSLLFNFAFIYDMP